MLVGSNMLSFETLDVVLLTYSHNFAAKKELEHCQNKLQQAQQIASKHQAQMSKLSEMENSRAALELEIAFLRENSSRACMQNENELKTAREDLDAAVTSRNLSVRQLVTVQVWLCEASQYVSLCDGKLNTEPKFFRRSNTKKHLER